jgi:hypothetical protein
VTDGRGAATEAPPPGASRAPRDPLLAWLVHVLDQALHVPGTRIRVGLDALVGLIFPGGGDVAGAVLSAVVVLLAVRHGLPAIVVLRMVANVAIDLLVGVVPVVGDLFDVAWKANTRNLRLLEAHAHGRRRAGWRDWVWVGALLAGLGVLVAGVVVLVVLALRAIGARLL